MPSVSCVWAALRSGDGAAPARRALPGLLPLLMPLLLPLLMLLMWLPT
ncbi:hypothetical protein ACFPA8_03320 [Streptomyces ovatisporus]|uniref:ABC transporter permease n=1 Tax=Streptomyces ovatisporus TaxID=1128682 RepID=A0ABV8ZZR3_9ACTN